MCVCLLGCLKGKLTVLQQLISFTQIREPNRNLVHFFQRNIITTHLSIRMLPVYMTTMQTQMHDTLKRSHKPVVMLRLQVRWRIRLSENKLTLVASRRDHSFIRLGTAQESGHNKRSQIPPVSFGISST